MTTTEFALYELKQYMAQMGCEVEITLQVDEAAFDTKHFFKYDSFFDDAFKIYVKNGIGTISGTNERSLLYGVYHFLKKQGCRFLRPGKEGEYIPYTGNVKDVSECWYAAVRHRGTTDGYLGGGGKSLIGILDYIDWMPKMMMNSFFTELTDYYSTMRIKFQHNGNPYKKPEEISRETFRKYDKQVVDELKKRSLIRHSAGHGWTVALMDGIEMIGHVEDNVTTCSNAEILAEVEGERKFFKGKSLFTNLCYSKDIIRKRWAELVYSYSLQHPEVDVIHVWLADYFSNFCECEECRKLSQADWYVKLLNEIDAEFTKHESKKKIAFLIYFELAYPPLTERLENEDRFIMMFAPYGRDFSKTYKETPATDYVRKPLNQFDWEDMRMDYYLKQLYDWKEIFKGDSFVFDYSLLDRVSHTEITDVLFAPIPHKDCLCLWEYGLNGRIECGDTRGMTPTAITYHGMYEAMFYHTESYEDIEKDYFISCYGEGEPISTFLHAISRLLPREYMLLHSTVLTEENQKNLDTGFSLIQEFKKTLQMYVPDNRFHLINCYYFKEYLELLEFIFIVLLQKSKGCSSMEMDKFIDEYQKLVFRKEAVMPTYMTGRQWFIHIKSSFTNKDENKQF